jgi:hypothetical protein
MPADSKHPEYDPPSPDGLRRAGATCCGTHPAYDLCLPAWGRARDVLAGEDAVKAAGRKYLPRLDGQSDAEYEAYKTRASFFGATSRTVEEYLDLIFRKAPVIEVAGPEPLRAFVVEGDGCAAAITRYGRRVVNEVLSVGRAASMVLPGQDGRPVVSMWRAEDILNWTVERSWRTAGERMVLSRVVLRDGDRIRVLSVEPGEADGTNGARERVCVVELWQPARDQKDGSDQREWELVEAQVLVREGKPVPFIPFVFHGPRNSQPEPDRLPLADLIAANLDHYRLDADYKNGLHFAALPTAWVSGFDKATVLRIGSSEAWMSQVPGATAGFLEFNGAGLGHLEQAMDKVERRMALLGARMTTGVVANGLPANDGGSGDLCGLGSIVASLNESLSRVLQIACWWILGGDVDAQAARFAMNTDLAPGGMRGEEIMAVVAAWRAGAISRDTMLERLKRGEVLPDGRTVAQEVALIHGKAKAI